MKLNRMFRALSSMKSGRKSRRSSRTVSTERLETRALLAGNVLLNLSGGNATLTGDQQDNSIEILATGGSIVVRGLNGTQINGSSNDAVLANGSLSFAGILAAHMGAGNDTVKIGTGMTFQRQVGLSGDAGNDNLATLGSTFNSSLAMDGGAGTNGLQVSGSTVRAGVYLNSAGAATVLVQNSIISGALDITTGEGADGVVVRGSTVGGNAKIWTNGGDDDIVLRNTTINGRLDVMSGAGNDVVFVDSTSVSRAASIQTRRGDDNVQIQGTSSFGRRLRVLGGAGADAMEVVPPAGTSRVRRAGFSSRQVADSVITNRILDATNGAVGKADALSSLLSQALTVAIAADSIAENAGATATNVTITRSGSTTSSLEVTLASSNTQKATVPATAVIPAGSASVTVAIAAVDNVIADASAIVTITATATSYVQGTDTVTVTNEDTAALTLTSSVATVAETAGADAVTYTLKRNTADNSAALTVQLASGTASRLTVPASVEFAANSDTVTFKGSLVNNTTDDGDVNVVVTATANGLANGTTTVQVTDDDAAALTLTVQPTSIGENGATDALEFTLSRNSGDVTQALTVNLTSGNVQKVVVPASVTIPANASSVTFKGSPVDNTADEVDASVIVTAVADTFANGTVTVIVTDNDAPALGVTSALTTVPENGGANAIEFTLTRNVADTSSDLVVALSGNSSRLTVPSSVTIPAGQSSVSFFGSPADNAIYEGDFNYVVNASANGLTADDYAFVIDEDEAAPPASLTAGYNLAEIAENSTGTVTLTVIRLNADTTQDLVVSLSTTNADRLNLPTTLTIPAGQTSASVVGTPVQNQAIDGTEELVTTVSATGFANTTASLSVTDDDFATMSMTPQTTTADEAAGTLPITIALNRTSSEDLTVNLFYSQTRRISGPTSVVIPAGQTTVTVDFDVHNNSVVDGSAEAQVLAIASGTSQAFSRITMNDSDSFGITTDISANTFEQSVGTVVTRNALFHVAGTTTPGASITVDTDDDGVFDEVTTTADINGHFEFDVTLTRGTTPECVLCYQHNHLDPSAGVLGSNMILIRAEHNGQTADAAINVHLAEGTIVRMASSVGDIDVELLDADAPITVQNFLTYMTANAFDNLIVHRNVSSFVIQGGGYTVDNSGFLTPVVTNAPIANEFKAQNSNEYGTLSMALVGDDFNSGTSQWFINMRDNTDIDTGKYTVFGRVIGAGMDRVTQINALTVNDFTNVYQDPALNTVPLLQNSATNTDLTGLITMTNGSTTLTGNGTLFTTELTAGDTVKIGGRAFIVQSVESNTSMTVTRPADISGALLAGTKDVLPHKADFVVFSDFLEILDQI